MRLLVGSEIKQATIGQSLMKAMKAKRVIPPLLFGLGVEMNYIVGSRILIIELEKLGFWMSYDKVTRFKHSVAIQSHSEDEENVSSFFLQWVGDNCNQNANILDGKGVFHLMGITECTISQGDFQDKPIKRIKHLLKSSEVTKQPESKSVGTTFIHAVLFQKLYYNL